jgi:uncharacterized protein GlcG (DUF336 family)
MGVSRYQQTLAEKGLHIVIGQGAVPIVIDSTVVGAVGVSGGIPVDLDHAIAEAAVRAG